MHYWDSNYQANLFFIFDKDFQLPLNNKNMQPTTAFTNFSIKLFFSVYHKAYIICKNVWNILISDKKSVRK